MMSLENRISEIIVSRLNVKPEEVTPTANLKDDLGADSLDMVDLMMDLEDEFNLKISDEEGNNLQTVGAVVEFLNSKGIEA
ncbi:MAG TPA: acyl carrier protein [Candidatus Sabulitectum sp.]|jgi:acyl carrier protein|nr:acyl carrier protein [Candidatus Sabulitectum sp.]HPF32423.1 acyl carrier protein [Candidatus Sabulitectum sp.]HPJ28651.1 acyl carrier protein [Candidatus Sabulitectum sp.]HPR22199.1 acyl carrier protein [Candidatus Sabulitectum sp.]HRW77857.1 acyl carrier protein [Candidatus Sabulitectum sp.]